jgi:hypothetical protein
MTSKHSAPAVPLVPPYRAAERRNAASNCGTEHRNDSGTVDLETLANQVLSRSRGGTPMRNDSGTEALSAFRTPRNAPCPHVTDPDLAEWFAENPKLTCARCWLERRGRPIQEAL